MFQVGSSSELEVDIAILCFTCDRTVQYWPGCPEPFFPPIVTINSESRNLKFIFQALSPLTSKEDRNSQRSGRTDSKPAPHSVDRI
jgi:hypothetical protein